MELISQFSMKAGEVSSKDALRWFNEKSFSNIPPYFLTHWKTDKSFFYFNDSLIAFEKTKKYLVIAGESLSLSGDENGDIYKAFLDFANKLNKKVCGYYVGANWRSDSFLKRPLGTSFRIDLSSYDFDASKAKEVRRSLRKGASQGYEIIESKEIDLVKLKSLLKKWKSKKLPLKLKFFLSEPKVDCPVALSEKWYVIQKEGEYYAFCSMLPYMHEGRKGFYVDHLAYDPLHESFALSYLISALMYKLKSSGVEELNLGLNPFAKITPSGSIEKLFSYLYKMPFLYRPKGLHYFKSKFSGEEEQEFIFHEKKESPWLSLLGIALTTFKK